LLTPEGSKRIEDFRVGDLILSRSEDDPDGPVRAKAAEALFVRVGRLWKLLAGGKEIWTTGQHLFWVRERGWIQVNELLVGDFLVGRDGGWVLVEEVEDTGRYETVYNLRVSDFHTYFVGCEEWGFSVWAHNTCYEVKMHNGKLTLFEKGATEPVEWNPSSGRTGPRTFDNRQQAQAQLKKINNGAAPDMPLPMSRQRSSKRRAYMGQNPKPGSPTYEAVVRRMERDGQISERGGKKWVKASDGEWIPIEQADLAHRVDAMKWWNEEGKYWGPKHQKVKDFMNDPNNYTLDQVGPQRSAGAKLKDIGYDPPDPRPGGPPQAGSQ
jgi:hypothetical protein